MILTGFERAALTEKRAEKAEEIAVAERWRAEKLAQRLKELGIEPEE